jgi:methionine-S-sulfoxide reductase
MTTSLMNTSSEKIDTATFGTGCFWCTEAIFEQLNGVLKVTSGYAGGHVKNPTYKQVCDGETGHAECVQIHYEPEKISYDELLEVFWQVHDPTTLNRQGADVGTQYRSAIFYHTLPKKKKQNITKPNWIKAVPLKTRSLRKYSGSYSFMQPKITTRNITRTIKMQTRIAPWSSGRSWTNFKRCLPKN